MFRATMCPSSGENCVYATLSSCYSVWMDDWYAKWNEFHPAYQRVIHTE